MESQFTDEVLQKIEDRGVIAVLVIDDVNDAMPLASALLDGGIDLIELTLRTEAALASVIEVRKLKPQMTVGIGTILNTQQVKQVVDAGGSFGVAPGLNESVVRQAQASGLPFAPGIVTPSEIERAVELGCRELKFFPAEPSGGIAYLKSMAAPYAHLNLRYIPLGGLSADNMASYLETPLVPAIGGSWIAPRLLIQQQAWGEITERAAAAIDIAKQTKRTRQA